MELRLSEQDRQQLLEHGLSEETVRLQLQRFADGTPFTTLERTCTINDGIHHLDDSERSSAIAAHSEAAKQGRFMKMVPASGAASRMFKTLLTLHGSGHCKRSNLKARATEGDEDAEFGLTFFDRLTDFAFFTQLDECLAQQGLDVDEMLESGDFAPILASLLDDICLNMPSLPKGLIAFHWDGDDIRTPVAEHLLEAIETIRTSHDTVRLHFTVSSEHQGAFENEVQAASAPYPDTNFTIEFSQQAPSTDTIAADMNNQPFRDEDGRLLFRPGGHGALLKNLNELDADLVFIKNVDNVLPPSKTRARGSGLGAQNTEIQSPESTTNCFEEKRVLGGYAVQLLAKRDEALRDLEGIVDADRLHEIERFVFDELELHLPDYETLSVDQKQRTLYDALNRPLRVCGMVPNEGEPGGGPFWVKRSDGRIDRQIVETGQVDTNDAQQNAILQSATHFNPVDLVCCLRDHHGNPYDLQEFVDHEAAFISHKSQNGRDLKALELPGLWNGSMADWLTVFVEVPAGTFNPVKTVNDLLRDEHRGYDPP